MHPKLKKIKYIIFDWDGVISDSFGLEHQKLKEMAIRFKKSYPCENMDELRQWYKEPFMLMFENMGFDWEKDKHRLKKFHNEFHNKAHTPLFHGMHDMLKRLAVRYTLAIVSSNTKEVLDRWTREHHVESYFKEIFAWHENRNLRPKPAPDLILKCIQSLGAKKVECIYIGDQKFDIRAAKSAGIMSIGVTWGYGHKDHIIDERPDFTINTQEELLELFC